LVIPQGIAALRRGPAKIVAEPDNGPSGLMQDWVLDPSEPLHCIQQLCVSVRSKGLCNCSTTDERCQQLAALLGVAR
jgi:hypothetical protein